MNKEIQKELSLDILLKMTKKQLIVYGGFKNAKDLIASGMYQTTGMFPKSYLPSRKELARDLAA